MNRSLALATVLVTLLLGATTTSLAAPLIYVVDNDTGGYTLSYSEGGGSAWSTFTGAWRIGASRKYLAPGSNAGRWARYTLPAAAGAGEYHVMSFGAVYSTHDGALQYDIVHDGGTTSQVISQQQTVGGYTGMTSTGSHSGWRSHGTFDLAPNAGYLQITANNNSTTSGYVGADTVVFANGYLVDDRWNDDLVTRTGTWNTGTGMNANIPPFTPTRDTTTPDSRFAFIAAGSEATLTIDSPFDDDLVAVYASWVANSGNSSAAQLQLFHAEGTYTTTIDQTRLADGTTPGAGLYAWSDWHYLGDFQMDATSYLALNVAGSGTGNVNLRQTFFQVVPEPGSLALLAMALVPFALRRRRSERVRKS